MNEQTLSHNQTWTDLPFIQNERKGYPTAMCEVAIGSCHVMFFRFSVSINIETLGKSPQRARQTPLGGQQMMDSAIWRW